VYKIVSPIKAASCFDFTVDPRTNEHTSDGLTEVRKAVVSVTRDLLRDEMSRIGVERVLGKEPDIGRAVLIRLRHSPRLRELGVRPVDVFIKDLKVRPDTVKALEGRMTISCAQQVAMPQGTDAGLPWQSKQTEPPQDDDASSGMECTEDCPFRHMCGDYMDDLRGGKAWCTLFREFST